MEATATLTLLHLLEVVHRLVQGVFEPRIQLVLGGAKRGFHRFLGLARAAGQHRLKPHARVGVVDPFGEQINRAGDPILPKTQNLRCRDPGTGVIRVEQPLEQIDVDSVEALADP